MTEEMTMQEMMAKARYLSVLYEDNEEAEKCDIIVMALSTDLLTSQVSLLHVYSDYINSHIDKDCEIKEYKGITYSLDTGRVLDVIPFARGHMLSDTIFQMDFLPEYVKNGIEESMDNVIISLSDKIDECTSEYMN